MLFCPPQLYFTCYLRSGDERSPTGRCTYGKDDLAVQLMFYNTFEVLGLPGSDPMETRRVVKLYEASPTPILYVCPVSNVMGRVPLMPLFLCGNSKSPYGPMIQLCRRHQGVGQEGKQRLRGQLMLWRFGRGTPQLWEGQATRTKTRRDAPKAASERGKE